MSSCLLNHVQILVWIPNVVVFTWHLANNMTLRQQGKDKSTLNLYLTVVEGYTYLFGGLYGLLLAIGMLKFRWLYLYISISLYWCSVSSFMWIGALDLQL